jgi:acetyl esterase/lipase
MTTPFSRSGSRKLVAPELLAGLDLPPPLDLASTPLATIRGGIGPAARQRPPLPAALQAVAMTQQWIPGPPGGADVRVLVYTPADRAANTRPAYLHLHGGGYVLGSPEINDAANRALALNRGCVVVSVDYRLAPETRFPGALEDSYAALAWLHAQAGALRVDRSRIAIGGDSAGGGHAAALSLLAHRRGALPICLQLLDAPMLDDRTGSTSEPHPYCGEFVWTPAHNRFGWQALLGVDPGSDDVPADAVPARAADLSGLPPTFIAVGALDLFVEENIEYARRLIRAGVPTELHVLPGAYHGFGVQPTAPQVQAYQRLRSDALARAWA